MRKRILQLSTICVAVLFSTQVFAEDTIAYEGFGETNWAANPQDGTPVEGSSYNPGNGSTGFYQITELVLDAFDCENGIWVSGSDSSIRTETYFITEGQTKSWEGSSNMHACLNSADRYGGAWDTLMLTQIDIADYKYLELKFGWTKRPGWVNPDSVIRGLNIEYRIDGGDWVNMDTTKLASPFTPGNWSYAEELYIDERGNELDLRFTAYFYNNQIALDDILLLGQYVQPIGMETKSGNNFQLFPNPVGNTLNIQLSNVENATYEIFRLDGTKVSAGMVESNIATIDVSDFISGVYMVSLNLNGKLETAKFVK